MIPGAEDISVRSVKSETDVGIDHELPGVGETEKDELSVDIKTEGIFIEIPVIVEASQQKSPNQLTVLSINDNSEARGEVSVEIDTQTKEKELEVSNCKPELPGLSHGSLLLSRQASLQMSDEETTPTNSSVSVLQIESSLVSVEQEAVTQSEDIKLDLIQTKDFQINVPQTVDGQIKHDSELAETSSDLSNGIVSSGSESTINQLQTEGNQTGSEFALKLPLRQGSIDSCKSLFNFMTRSESEASSLKESDHPDERLTLTTPEYELLEEMLITPTNKTAGGVGSLVTPSLEADQGNDWVDLEKVVDPPEETAIFGRCTSVPFEGSQLTRRGSDTVTSSHGESSSGIGKGLFRTHSDNQMVPRRRDTVTGPKYTPPLAKNSTVPKRRTTLGSVTSAKSRSTSKTEEDGSPALVRRASKIAYSIFSKGLNLMESVEDRSGGSSDDGLRRRRSDQRGARDQRGSRERSRKTREVWSDCSDAELDGHDLFVRKKRAVSGEQSQASLTKVTYIFSYVCNI